MDGYPCGRIGRQVYALHGLTAAQIAAVVGWLAH